MNAPVKFTDRVLVLGSTGSGKSELLNLLFSSLHGGAQRLLVDTKHEFGLHGLGPVTGGVDAIPWDAPIIVYQDQSGGPEEMQKLFNACFHRRRLVVCVHELSDICDYNANRTPPAFNAYVSKGRALGLGLLAGSQRPCEIPSRARSESDHVFLFAQRFQLAQDHKAAAGIINRDPAWLADVLDEVLATYGRHAFLRFNRGDGSLVVCEPLTDAERAGIIVTRPTLY